MLLSDLSLSGSAASAKAIKGKVENLLSQYLPQGSFTVVLRSYQGDFRTRNNSVASYQAMILLDKAGKQAAIEHKGRLESAGFQVSPAGEIKLILN